MTVALAAGEIVNGADATTGFNVGNISADDAFVEPTGAIGLKCSNTLCRMYTTTLGAGAPYDFSSAGAEFGYHLIMWFNSKSNLNAASGMRIIVGDTVGGDRAEWDVPQPSNYTGGFIVRVIDPAVDFSRIEVGTGFTLTGNPAQLTNVNQIGGALQTISAIMGAFNNIQLDQFTVGTGLRIDAGTVGTPNTFETVRAQDEDTTHWGWWTSANGVLVGRGKLEIGPATGSATSVFKDVGEAVIVFADEPVAVGFYEITSRGAGTDVTLDGLTVRAENPANARWSITVDSTTLTWTDDNAIYVGFDVLTLDSTTTLTAAKLEDGNSIVQNGATIDGCTVTAANTATGVALITSDDPGKVKNNDFTFSAGHAIEITAIGTYTLDGNVFTGYGADATNDAAIYNNSGGIVTLNVINGLSPTVRNGTGASTTVNNNVTLKVTTKDINNVAIASVRVGIFRVDTGAELMNLLSDVNGVATTTFNFASDLAVSVRGRKGTTGGTKFFPVASPQTITSGGLDVTLTLIEDSINTA